MKKLLVFFLFVLCACIVPTEDSNGSHSEQPDESQTSEEPSSRNGVLIYAATDIHYLSDELHDDGEMFQKLMSVNYSKLTEYVPDIMDTFIDCSIEAKPDAVILTGDLTYNGEYQSLLDLKEKLLKLKEADIPVLVIPGNHDIDVEGPLSYIGYAVYPVENISKETFFEEMSMFGYDDAILKDETTFSYVYELKDDVWCIGLDANSHGYYGFILEPTLVWLEEVLTQAEEEGKEVLIFSHQNVLPQNETRYLGFALFNYENVEEILKRHNVKYVISGHSHIQHTAESEGLRDICMESLCIAPLSYGEIIFRDQGFQYKKVPLGIYEEEARARFDETTIRSVDAALEGVDVEPEIKEKMTQLALDFNYANFSQDAALFASLVGSEALEYWEKYAPNTNWFPRMKEALTP